MDQLQQTEPKGTRDLEIEIYGTWRMLEQPGDPGKGLESPC